jgi:hypothetical protein
VLYDSINERIIANAFPLSTGSQSIANNTTSKYILYNPVYTSGVLQQPPLANATVGGTSIVNTSSQTITLVSSANIALQSGYGFASQNRDTLGSLFSTTVYPVTANTMNASDRVRSAIGSLDLVMTGQSWGPMTSGAQGQTTIAAINGFVNVNGSGSVATAVGGTYGAFITPSAGLTANIQYQTGIMPFLTLLSTAGTTGKANVVYNRAVAPFIAGQSANLTVQYAVGLHTYSGWSGSGAVGTANNPVLGRFAVLNEDANTTIQSNGPLVNTGNVTFSSNVILDQNSALISYRERTLPTLVTTGELNLNTLRAPVYTVTASGNITVNTNNIQNATAGTSVTLIVTQDATGGRLLNSNLLYAGGSKTLSTAANAIDIINIFTPNGTTFYASLVKGYA